MQTLGIILMVFAVVVGLALGLWQSKTRSQRAAVLAAFLSLAVLIALFCFVVVAQQRRDLSTVFVIACVVIPSILYLLVGRLVSDKAASVSPETASAASDATEKKAKPTKKGKRGGKLGLFSKKRKGDDAGVEGPQDDDAPVGREDGQGGVPAPASDGRVTPSEETRPAPAPAQPAPRGSATTAPAPAPAPAASGDMASPTRPLAPAAKAQAPAEGTTQPSSQQVPAAAMRQARPNMVPAQPPAQQSRPATMRPLPENRMETLAWNKKNAGEMAGSLTEDEIARIAEERAAAKRASAERIAVQRREAAARVKAEREAAMAANPPSQRPPAGVPSPDPREEQRRIESRRAEQDRIAAERRVAAEKAMAQRRAAAGIPAPAEQAAPPSPRPAAAPTPAPVPAPPQVAAPAAPEASVFDSERYFTRATLLRDRGLFSAAAKLYAECASLTPDRHVFCRASIEQIACYVKGGMPEQARELAEDLKANAPELTMGERIKIDAVLKLAEQA